MVTRTTIKTNIPTANKINKKDNFKQKKSNFGYRF